jgi:hypothetical protein
MVHDPALAARVVVRGPKPAPWMIFRVLPKPRPQPGIGVSRGRCSGLMALRGSVLPGHPTGEPLRHTHRADEVVNGRPPAFRA